MDVYCINSFMPLKTTFLQNLIPKSGKFVQLAGHVLINTFQSGKTDSEKTLPLKFNCIQHNLKHVNKNSLAPLGQIIVNALGPLSVNPHILDSRLNCDFWAIYMTKSNFAIYNDSHYSTSRSKMYTKNNLKNLRLVLLFYS